MTERITALIIHQNPEILRSLKFALERLGLGVTQAESLAQAKRMLGGLNPAPLVFTDIQFLDGSWTDILALAEKAARPVNVIVVARVADTQFYVETIEAGAFDFIVPPFYAADLAHVVRCAMDNVLTRRTAERHHSQGVDETLLAKVPAASLQATMH